MDSQTTKPTGTAEPLLERSRELSLLSEWLRDVGALSRGRLVLVAGEAGVGKTTLLRRACADAPVGTRILWGACDSLFTPQPLGPLLDIADETGGEFAELIADGAKPYALATALLRELAQPAPALVVIEDLHWADEASLDVLRVVARRIGTAPILMLASYRHDGLDRRHPLRVVLGELATTEHVTRMVVSPLSLEAVAELAGARGLDADQLYRATGGNPFYVTEVLAAGDEQIPDTVRDAVLARITALSPSARRLLEAAAVIPPPVDPALLAALTPPSRGALDECLTAGVLTTAPTGLAFRHDLARLAVEGSVPLGERRDLNARALAALSDQRSAGAEVARLAHHAEEAGDAAAVLRLAPLAAVEAAGVGAHYEAASQYERALRFADDAPAEVRAELFEWRSHECTLVGEFSDAIAAGREALAAWRALGNRVAEGRALGALAWPLWSFGSAVEAKTAARSAVDLLEELPHGPELVAAYVSLASVLWATAPAEAVAWGQKGLALAEHLGEREWAVQARVATATAKLWCSPSAGRGELEETLELACREGVETAAGYAYAHLAGSAVRDAEYTLGGAYITAGIDYCNRYDLDGYRPFLVAVRAEAELAQGRWDEAAASTAVVLARHGAGAGTASCLSVLGALRARRGDPGVWEALDEAARIVSGTQEAWRVCPVAVSRAEAAWLEGRLDAIVEETQAGFDAARQIGAGWAIGELGVWRARAGHKDDVVGAIEPWASQLAGDWRGASSRWTELGAPYAAALALADGDDDDALRRALDELQAMGAVTAAAIVARRLRSRGARGLPRGPRPQTRENPANLTSRELEILGLVAEGRRNAEIAEHLFLSQKTVAHHVSAILRKLGVHNRGEAAAAAMRLGLTAEDR